MRQQLRLTLALLASLAGVAFAGTYTDRLDLYRPSQSETGWATAVNNNFTTLDSSVAVLSDTQTFTGSVSFTNPVTFSSMSLTQIILGTSTYSGTEPLVVNGIVKFFTSVGGVVSLCDQNALNCTNLTVLNANPAAGIVVTTMTVLDFHSSTATISVSNISSGTFSSSLRVSGMSPGQCVQTDSSGKLITSGAGCGGGGVSALAITTGTASGWSTIASSPTVAINFDSTTFRATLKGASTAFVELSGVMPSLAVTNGLSASTLNISSNSVLNGATFYHAAGARISTATINFLTIDGQPLAFKYPGFSDSSVHAFGGSLRLTAGGGSVVSISPLEVDGGLNLPEGQAIGVYSQDNAGIATITNGDSTGGQRKVDISAPEGGLNISSGSLSVALGDLTVTSLASQSCVGTDSDGKFQAGTCSGGGGGGGSSSLEAIFGTARSSPTATLKGSADFLGSVTSSTMTISMNPQNAAITTFVSSVTANVLRTSSFTAIGSFGSNVVGGPMTVQNTNFGPGNFYTGINFLNSASPISTPGFFFGTKTGFDPVGWVWTDGLGTPMVRFTDAMRNGLVQADSNNSLYVSNVITSTLGITGAGLTVSNSITASSMTISSNTYLASGATFYFNAPWQTGSGIVNSSFTVRNTTTLRSSASITGIVDVLSENRSTSNASVYAFSPVMSAYPLTTSSAFYLAENPVSFFGNNVNSPNARVGGSVASGFSFSTSTVGQVFGEDAAGVNGNSGLGGGTATNVYGVRGTGQTDVASLTSSQYGLWAQTKTLFGSTATVDAGVYISSPVISNNSVVNDHYGLYIDSQTVLNSSRARSIYTAGASPSYLGGTTSMPLGASVSTLTITGLPSQSCLGTDGSGNVQAGSCSGGGGGSGGYNLQPASVTIQANFGITGTSVTFSSGSFIQNSATLPDYPNAPLLVGGNANTFLQANIQNMSSGDNASGDLVITSNLGGNTSNYVNLGINGSGYNQASFSITPASAAYLYSSDHLMVIGSGANGTDPLADTVFFTNNPVTANERLRIQYNGAVTVTSSMTVKANVRVGDPLGNTVLSVSTTSASPDAFQLTVSSQNGTVLIGVQNNGHIISSGTTPTLSSCGTGPAISGTDVAGTVTAGATATGCTVTFSRAYIADPICIVTPQTGSVTNTFSYTHSTTAITVTETGLGGTKFDFQCIGRQ